MVATNWQRVVIALLALAVVFAAGYWLGGERALHLPIYTGDGYVGANQASFPVGDTTYGFESSVAWTDKTGAEHDSGWPECLPQLHDVKGVRFSGAILWHGDSGIARVVWVDCQDHGAAQ
jgi:hypothetical protein